MNDNQNDHPDVIAPPPVIFCIFFFTGVILDLIFQIDLFPINERNLAILIPGYTVILISLLIVSTSVQNLKKHNTTHKVNKPTSNLVKTGIYKYSRNPIYLSVLILFIGVSVILNSLIILILVIPLFFILDQGVIKREEIYLESKFGTEYTEYKKKVRRWI